MKLDLLLDREPFDRVFIETFGSFLESEFEWTGTIDWRPPRPPFERNSLLANGKLNVIYPQPMARRNLRPLTVEFAYNSNPISYLLQNIFVRCGASFPMEWLTTTATIKITPWPKQIDNLCVIPGNHSLRIVDLDRDQCHVLLKKGFNKKFILNEISVRRQFPFLPIPELIDADEQSGRYTEERIEALPWDRISDSEIKKTTLAQAQQVLMQLYGETRQACQVSERVDELTAKLKDAVNELPPCFGPLEFSQVFSLLKKLSALVVSAGNHMIETVQSHGDFQPANILVSVADGSNKLYLIDWEYSERRYCGYDALVFASRSRAPVGFAGRLMQLMKANVEDLSQWGRSLDRPESEIKGWMVALFLMEDLLVRIQEMKIPELKHGDGGLGQFLAEASEWTACCK